ncbi:MAG TPA: tyrosine--tRNA ligase [Candidatus Methylacidiphilales bacterium]|jgi:tyrosyl-tRNA synthetase|nr:tyrosine--tRNA ligase [Candidatus Methylacidiphilales bacterium]
MASTSILQDLHWRGLVADMANRDELERLLARGATPVALYAGFDPTADSLHLGHLISLLILRRFQLAGHRPIAVAGGATGMIGDPSGKSAERNLLSAENLEANIAGIEAQLGRLLDFESKTNPALLLNNADWVRPMSVLDFLRDVGKHFSVNAMMAKDSVKSRMESAAGISFTEFGYSLLQAYDFLHLQEKHGCLLQVGGADQWGNITAGIDLIRRKREVTACGLTTPLLTKTDGTKFGKTEGGAVWLSPARTSVYRFYQFLIQVEDAQVIQLLKFFTFLPQEEIAALEAQHQAAPERRDAHRKLALDLTRLVHGESAAADAVRASEILFGGSLEGITEAQFDEVIAEVPHVTLSRGILGQPGGALIEIVIAAGLSPSKGQARKDIEAGGINMNNVRVTDTKLVIGAEHLLFGKFVLLRKGKRNYALARFE